MNISPPQSPLGLHVVQSSQHVAPPRVRSLTRLDSRVVVWLALLVSGGVLGWLSVLRYNGYNAGMLDLGNMAQAISSVGRGRPLVTTFPDGSTSRLAVHVELIYFVFSLLYMLWSDPRLLVIVQAALFASGALPVYALALRHSRSAVAAVCLALAYLLYPVAQNSVLFDFHGDTLAMPLLLWALDALDRRVWWRYGLFIALALACKFYVAIPVAALGVVIWWCGDRRAGAITTAAAVMYGAIAFGIIRPFFTTASTAQTHRGMNYLLYYFGQVDSLLANLDQRLIAAVVVFVPALMLMMRGWRWLVPGLPIAAVVLLSSNGSSFDYRFHHYALVVPFIMMAAVHGLAPRPSSTETKRRGFPPAFNALLMLMLVVLFNATFVNAPLNPQWWAGAPGWGMDGSSYGVSARDRIKDDFLALVPPRVAVAASTFLAPHIAERDTLYSVRYPEDGGGEMLPRILPQVDYVIADALFDYRLQDGATVAGGASYERTEIGQVLRDPAFGLVDERDGLLMFKRDATGDEALAQQVEVVRTQTADAPTMAELARAEIAPLAPRRFRATFEWIAPTEARSLVAVSQLRGVAGSRVVHLPTYALLPTTQWQPGQHIQETFDATLSADIPAGSYVWEVAWYDLHNGEAYLTDGRSQVGPTLTVTTVNLP